MASTSIVFSLAEQKKGYFSKGYNDKFSAIPAEECIMVIGHWQATLANQHETNYEF